MSAPLALAANSATATAQRRLAAEGVRTAAFRIAAATRALGGYRTMSARASVGIHARKSDSLRVFELDRPSALNALNLEMINVMAPQLKAWNESDLCRAIMLTNVKGSRGFCAGGDVKQVVQNAASGKPDKINDALKFFEEEYKLNHMIATLNKPYISVMNGIMMGGGVGLSVHGAFRIATENTVFAMPETSIGLFPDVGGSFFLPRLDGELGTFLGLTGHVLKGQEVFYAGVATHYIQSSMLPTLYARLGELESDDFEVVNGIIDEYSVSVEPDAFKKWSLGDDVARAINRCFKFNTIEEIFAALEKEKTAWSKQQLQTLKSVSPTSLKVTLAQIRRGATLDIANCFRMEYRITRKMLSGKDFIEGVTAKLINKPATKPKWNPSMDRLSEISNQAIPSLYLQPEGKELALTNPFTYHAYPHHTLSGLPTDHDLRRIVSGDTRRSGMITQRFQSREEVLHWVCRQWGRYDKTLMTKENPPLKPIIEGGQGRGKIGLWEKVSAVLDMHTIETDGHVKWESGSS